MQAYWIAPGPGGTPLRYPTEGEPVVTSKEFVAGLMEEMEHLFARLGETETLESESDGRVDVIYLLQLALKRGVRAVAARTSSAPGRSPTR